MELLIQRGRGRQERDRLTQSRLILITSFQSYSCGALFLGIQEQMGVRVSAELELTFQGEIKVLNKLNKQYEKKIDTEQ